MKECHTVMIKGSIHQNYVAIINIHAPNFVAPTYTANINRTEGKSKKQHNNSRQLQYFTFNNGLFILTETNKKTLDINYILDLMNLMDIHETFYSTATKYIFF